MTTGANKPRRDFLKLTGIGAFAAAAAALPEPAHAQQAGHPFSGPLPRRWDGEYRLVIVGGGGTGLCAAVEAVQRKVPVLA